MSPVQLLFRPSPWVDFFDFCFLLRWCSGWPLGLFCRVTYQVTNGWRWGNKIRFRNFIGCAARIAQLCGRIAELGLHNLACATPRIAQLRLRNFQDCATLIAQLLGLRNSACATTFDRLRNSQDCATLWSDCASRIAQLGLRNSQDCATLWPDCATWLAQLPGLRNSLVGLRS